MKLMHGQNILAEIREAKSFYLRTRGLMFRSTWDKDTTLWIHRCNSIHTAFMRFPIDAVFVDKSLKIKKLVKGIAPWRLILPVFSASSVFEFVSSPNGHEKLSGLNVGDQLHVGD